MKRSTSKFNGLIALNKPQGLTSHDVVSQVRKILGERRVGHAGTLDPMATGVLIVGVGQATRLLGHITQDTKTYTARISFGYETTTYDAEGEVISSAVPHQELFSPVFAQETLTSFEGTQMQTPPAYSAISKGGVRAYELARAGQHVELDAREICVYAASLLSIEKGKELGNLADTQTRTALDPGKKIDLSCSAKVSWNVSFTVSKGTYIRSLAHDIGKRVGCPAYLSALTRTKAGVVKLCQCMSLDELKTAAQSQKVQAAYLEPVRILGAYPVELDEKGYQALMCGQVLQRQINALQEVLRAHKDTDILIGFLYQDTLVGLWRVMQDTQAKGQAKLACVANFPVGIGGVGEHA